MKYLVVYILLFINSNTFAQDTSFVKRKLFIEFSLYGLWSKCELEQGIGEELAAERLVLNTGSMVRFIYEINQKHAVSCGINYYRSTLSFNYTLEKDKYNLPYPFYGPLDYKTHVLSIPFSYLYSIPLTDKFVLTPEVGYYFTFPIIIDEVNVGVSYLDNETEKQIITANYSTTKHISGIFLAIGLNCLLQKKNEIKISIISNISVKKQVFGNFTFFPDNQEFTSTGKIKSGFGFIGLNISYLLTHNKKR